MKEKFRKISDAMDSYIKTNKFRMFRTLILVLGFTVTGCVCFLAGFFLNRDDNMIYKSNINAIERASSETVTDAPEVTEAPEETEEAVQTTVTVTEPPKVTLSRELLDSYIYEDLEFAPFEYRYTNYADFKNRTTVSDFSLPLTKKSFTISYDGIISAGFSPDKIRIETDDDLYTIRITLPSAHILSHEILPDTFRLENVQDNFFNPITSDDYMNICESQKFRMEQKAEADGIYKKMYSAAENEITEYLKRDSIIGTRYKIEFILPDDI